METPVTGWSIASSRLQGVPASSNSLAFIIKATDNNGCQSATKTLTLNPTCPTISTSSIVLASTTATVGVAYDQAITGASGGTLPHTYSLDTPIPTGWSIVSGNLQGTPTSTSSLTFKIKATDNNGCSSTTTKTITLNPACPTISTSSIVLASTTATVGVAYDQAITGASGGTLPHTYSLDTPIPTGWSIISGNLLGTPTSTSSLTFKIKATDNNGCSSTTTKTLTLNPTCPTISTSSITLGSTTATVGVAYDQAISGVSGGTSPHIYTLESPVPSGWSIASNRLQGTPTSTSSLIFKIKATDNNGCSSTTTKDITLTPTCPIFSINSWSGTIPSATKGSPYTSPEMTVNGTSAGCDFEIVSHSGNGTWNISGNKITGTPADDSENIVVRATLTGSSCTSTNQTFKINANCPSISVNSVTLTPATATIGTSYTGTISGASGGATPYKYELIYPVPAGWSMASNGTTLQGTPTAVSNSFIVRAIDNNGCLSAATKTLTLTTSCPPFTIDSWSSTPAATVGESYTSPEITVDGATTGYTFSMVGGTPSNGTWSINGNKITGTPATSGSVTITVRATLNNTSCTSPSDRTFTIPVNCPTFAVDSWTGTIPTAAIGQTYYSLPLTVGGTSSGYTFAIVGQSGSSSWSIDSYKRITGIPTVGSETVTVQATLGSSTCTSPDKTFTITANCPTISVGSVALTMTSATAAIGTPYTGTISGATGGTSPYKYTLEPIIPDGWSIASDGYTLQGIPTTSPTSFTVRATDANGCPSSSTKSLSLTTGCPTIALATSLSASEATVGVAYSATIGTPTGGQEPYTYSLASPPSGWEVNGTTIQGTFSSRPSGGLYSLTVNVKDKYNCTGTHTYTITVNKGTPVITFTLPTDKKYGDEPFLVNASSSSNGAFTYTGGSSSVATVAPNNGQVTIHGAGSTTITASQAEDNNYFAATTEPKTLVISKTNQTIVDFTFGEEIGYLKDLSIQVSARTRIGDTNKPGLAVSFSSSNPEIASISQDNKNIIIHKAGTVEITASAIGDDNHNAATPVKKTLIINKATPEIQYQKLTNKTYGAAPIPIEAKVLDIDLPLTYESSNTNVAIINGTHIEIKGVGTTTISYKCEGNDNYKNVTITQTLTILPATVIIAVNDSKRQVNKVNPDFSAKYDGWVNDEGVSVLKTKPQFSTTATIDSPIGRYLIEAEGAVADNYTFIYTKGWLTVTDRPTLYATVDPVSRTYGDERPLSFTIKYTGFESGDNESMIDKHPEVTCDVQPNSPAGDYDIELSGGEDDKYDIDCTNGTLTVQRAVLTVQADDQTRFYGEPNPTLTFKYSGFQLGEDESVLEQTPTASTEATTESPAGAYSIIVSGGADDCYRFARVPGTLTIKSRTLTVMYGIAPFEIPINQSGISLADIKMSTKGIISVSISDEGKLIATILSTGETVLSVQSSSTISIPIIVTKATLIAKAEDYKRKQGDRNPDSWKINYEGFKYDDDINSIDELPIATCSAQSGSPDGDYRIVVSGGLAKNYVFDYQLGMLTIIASEQLPTAFTPNGDGINDIFPYTGYKVKIFNRLGVLLFEGDSGWDGRYKGRLVEPGVYFYISTSPQGVVQKGSVEVIRTK